MGITRIDNDIYRGPGLSAEQSSYVAINPKREAGTLVFGGSIASRESLGGQVACKLALDSFSSAVLDFFDTNPSSPDKSSFNVNVLESAFRSANISVYQFGHSLAAGGRMSASLIGAVINEGVVAVGRVGNGSAYLIREGECSAFFEKQETVKLAANVSSGGVGANSLVQVELSSIDIRPGDVFSVFSCELESDKILALGDFVRSYDFSEGKAACDLCQMVFPELSTVHFAMIAKIGADTIYLNEVVK